MERNIEGGEAAVLLEGKSVLIWFCFAAWWLSIARELIACDCVGARCEIWLIAHWLELAPLKERLNEGIVDGTTDVLAVSVDDVEVSISDGSDSACISLRFINAEDW